MGYQSALVEAGAKVIATMFAGSYQGTWGSVVIYQGKLGLVTGAFGSCSFCDAFESEFGFQSSPYFDERNQKYYSGDFGDDDREVSKEEFEKIIQANKQKLADFGKSYLHVIQDVWDIENQLKHLSKDEDDWYDHEQRSLLVWALDTIKQQQEMAVDLKNEADLNAFESQTYEG